MVDISKFEEMAKLSFSSEELDKLNASFSVLLQELSEIKNISLEDVQPLISVLDERNALREDISVKSTNKDELLKNAQEQLNGYFVVPKAI
jgi:aspartyl-tRNA(Asn)/glutamyl-tRNA(Gln) amidotransferase subunit C